MVIFVMVFVPPGSDIPDVSDDSEFLAMAITRNPSPDGLASETRESTQELPQNKKDSILFGFLDKFGTDHSRISILSSYCLLRC